MALAPSIAYSLVTIALIIGMFQVSRMADSQRKKSFRSLMTGALMAWVVILVLISLKHR